MMIRRDVFKQVNGFDEAFHLVYGDIDLCLRVLNAGYRNLYTPFVRLVHYEGKTRSHSYPTEDMRLGRDIFNDRIKGGDPYFNPNLSYAVQLPTLRPENEEDRLARVERMVRLSNPSGK
jgi:GT2 family glycosyltransferase